MKKIETVGRSARFGLPLRWYSGDGIAAHLMADERTTLCGYDVVDTVELPAWHKRCGNCRNKLQKLVDSALEPSPAFVRESVLITVTRPVKDNLEPIVDVLQRKLRSYTTWDCEFVFQNTAIVQPELADGEERKDVRSMTENEYKDDRAERGLA